MRASLELQNAVENLLLKHGHINKYMMENETRRAFANFYHISDNEPTFYEMIVKEDLNDSHIEAMMKRVLKRIEARRG